MIKFKFEGMNVKTGRKQDFSLVLVKLEAQ
jgi:hypothetical protein